MIVEGQEPTQQYRQNRRHAQYSYRDICDMVSRYQFKSTIQSGTYLFTIYNVHEMFTEQEFRMMMRYQNYGAGAHDFMYSDLDAELLYAVIKNMMSIPSTVNEYLNTFSSDCYDAIKLEDPMGDFEKSIENLITTAYNDMRNTEVESVSVLNNSKEKDPTGKLHERIQAAAVEWKISQQKYQNTLNEILSDLKKGKY